MISILVFIIRTAPAFLCLPQQSVALNKVIRVPPAKRSNPSITHSCALMIRDRLLLPKKCYTRSGPNYYYYYYYYNDYFNDVACSLWVSNNVGVYASVSISVSRITPEDINYKLLFEVADFMYYFQRSLQLIYFFNVVER